MAYQTHQNRVDMNLSIDIFNIWIKYTHIAMRPLILKCPSCNGDLAVSKLHCHACEIAIEGDFGIPALLRLSRAQLDFVEVFLKNRGNIREVERELGVSYPTVRARLDEVLDAIGFNLAPKAADDRARR